MLLDECIAVAEYGSRGRPCPYCVGTGNELNPTKVGSGLRNIRKKNGLTQAQVASRMKCSEAYVCGLEQGDYYWSTNLIQRYLTAVNA